MEPEAVAAMEREDEMRRVMQSDSSILEEQEAVVQKRAISPSRSRHRSRVIVLHRVKRVQLLPWYQQISNALGRTLEREREEEAWNEKSLSLRTGDTVLWSWNDAPCKVKGKKYSWCGLKADRKLRLPSCTFATQCSVLTCSFLRPGIFSSGSPQPSGSFTWTFTKPGTYLIQGSISLAVFCSCAAMS